jgi:hypothetical protein
MGAVQDTMEISYLIATIVIGLVTVFAGLMFLVPHAALTLVGRGSTLFAYGSKRTHLALYFFLAMLGLTVTTAAQFNDGGFYIRFDGIDFQYGVWVALTGVFLFLSLAHNSYYGLPFSYGCLSSGLAVGSALGFLFSGLSTDTRYIYWLSFACVLGALSLLLLVIYRHPTRRDFWPHGLYMIVVCLLFAFLAVCFLVSTAAADWASSNQTAILMATSTGALALFLTPLCIFTYDPVIESYANVPTVDASEAKITKTH